MTVSIPKTYFSMMTLQELKKALIESKKDYRDAKKLYDLACSCSKASIQDIEAYQDACDFYVAEIDAIESMISYKFE